MQLKQFYREMLLQVAQTLLQASNQSTAVP